MEKDFLWFLAILALCFNIYRINNKIIDLEKEIENIKIEILKEND